MNIQRIHKSAAQLWLARAVLALAQHSLSQTHTLHTHTHTHTHTRALKRRCTLPSSWDDFNKHIPRLFIPLFSNLPPLPLFQTANASPWFPRRCHRNRRVQSAASAHAPSESHFTCSSVRSAHKTEICVCLLDEKMNLKYVHILENICIPND